MSEVIVAKAGGSSNATAESVQQSLEWAEQSDIFVVSAPGKIKGWDGQKVTDLLLDSRKEYIREGTVSGKTSDEITARYYDIATGLGSDTMSSRWIDSIAPKVQETARQSEDAVSMLGERLQAEIYEALDFVMLDPGRSDFDLGSNPDAWRDWLQATVQPGIRYVLPGNTTRVNGRLVTFDRGGSDISGGLAAYGIEADLNLNLTDGPAKSADPGIYENDEQWAARLRHIDHMLYVEGRELGRNGTGLVHAAAMVPLLRANIPTYVRSTAELSGPYTTLDNDTERAKHREGNVIALSLMKDVAIHTVYEPGMAEAVGRLAEFERCLAAKEIALVDSQGSGVDAQKYFTEGKEAAVAAREALSQMVRHGEVTTKDNVDLITLVGYNLGSRVVDNFFDFVLNSGVDAQGWQHEDHDLSHGLHSFRVSVSSDQSRKVFDVLHALHIEQRPIR